LKRSLTLFLTTVFCICAIIAGCARLDDNLYEPSKVSAYLFDDYKGEVDFKLDSNFDVPANLITQFDLDSFDGKTTAKIKAVFVGDDSRIADPTYIVILYCHGNRDHMDFYWPRVKLLANAGGKNHFGILTFDYRGYGASSGEPSEQGLYADANAAIEWLREKGLTSDRFIIYGFSLGSAPAVELTANSRSTLVASKVILEAPFASADVMVQDASLLAIPASFVTNLKIDNAEEIRKISQPLLWLHGVDDDFLSIKTHGEVVYANHHGAEGSTKFPIRVSGAGHSNVPQKYGSIMFTDYASLVHAFINGDLNL
jgi:pimeloyl-ACP methyl ester carboxylesterase